MAESKLFVGDVEVLALTDNAGDFPIPLSQLFPGVRGRLGAVPAALPRGVQWPGYLAQPLRVLSPALAGTYHPRGYRPREQGHQSRRGPNVWGGGIDGRLLAELNAAGVRSEEVDTVFFTHLHPDHVGGNLSNGGATPRPTFPRARYVVHQTDWATFEQPEVQAATPFPFWEETLGPLETLGVLDLLPGERALTSDITAIPTPGHTPGHMSLAIVSGGQRALIMGDVAVHPAQITETDWPMRQDMDHPLAAQVRRQVFDRVEAEHMTLVVCHFPEPGFGRLVRVQGRRYWQGGL